MTVQNDGPPSGMVASEDTKAAIGALVAGLEPDSAGELSLEVAFWEVAGGSTRFPRFHFNFPRERTQVYS